MLKEKLPDSFFLNEDVLAVARGLLGKTLVSVCDGHRCSGIITELEAYCAPEDQASHARNNLRTNRTETMFAQGGRAYVYLCYGIHHLFNVVTGPKDMAHAVLIRAIEPLDGIDVMLKRRYPKQIRNTPPVSMTTGPGALSQAMGIDRSLDGIVFSSSSSPVWIEEAEPGHEHPVVVAGKRIGVEYAGASAEWPWRFGIQGSRYLKFPAEMELEK
jgi:DNA-3-methyladenine glycosylase